MEILCANLTFLLYYTYIFYYIILNIILEVIKEQKFHERILYFIIIHKDAVYCIIMYKDINILYFYTYKDTLKNIFLTMPMFFANRTWITNCKFPFFARKVCTYKFQTRFLFNYENCFYPCLYLLLLCNKITLNVTWLACITSRSFSWNFP